MELIPSLLFTLLCLPLFYVGVGALSISRYVDVSFALPLGNIQATRKPLKLALVVLAIIVCGSLVLVGMTLLLIWFENTMRVIYTVLDWSLLLFLFGTILNPRDRVVKHLHGAVIATVLTAAGLMWPKFWPLVMLLQGLIVSCLLLAWCRVSLGLLLVGSLGLFFYDILSVYGTGLMDTTVEAIPPDMHSEFLVTVPASLAPGADPSFLIGLGDILVPGFWMMLAFRIGQQHNSYRVVATTLGGICLGWIACASVGAYTHASVPALMCLIPGAILGYLVSAIPQGLHEKPSVS